MFGGRFSTKIARAGFRVVVVDRWSLFGGGRSHRFDCTYKRITLGQHKGDNNNQMIQLKDMFCVLVRYKLAGNF